MTIKITPHNYIGTFDFLMIHQNLLERCKLPDIINRGSKLIQISYGGCKLIDSCNFFQCSLDVSHSVNSETVHSFKFTIQAAARSFKVSSLKSFFPYRLINGFELSDEAEAFPPMEAFEPESMPPARKKDFLEWYSKEKEASGGTFQKRSRLREYCRQDVTVLAEICSKFTEACEELYGLDPFCIAPTLSSYSSKVFRGKFLENSEVMTTVFIYSKLF